MIREGQLVLTVTDYRLEEFYVDYKIKQHFHIRIHIYKKRNLVIINPNILHYISDCIFSFNVIIVIVYCNNVTITTVVYNNEVSNCKMTMLL